MIGFAGVPLGGVIRREGLWTGLSFEGGGKARACARERHAFEGRVPAVAVQRDSMRAWQAAAV